MTDDAARCDTCKFSEFVLDNSYMCRKRAPRPGTGDDAAWPRVNADDWCGEFATHPAGTEEAGK